MNSPRWRSKVSHPTTVTPSSPREMLLRLTPAQQAQVRQATGRNVQSIALDVDMAADNSALCERVKKLEDALRKLTEPDACVWGVAGEGSFALVFHDGQTAAKALDAARALLESVVSSLPQQTKDGMQEGALQG